MYKLMALTAEVEHNQFKKNKYIILTFIYFNININDNIIEL